MQTALMKTVCVMTGLGIFFFISIIEEARFFFPPAITLITPSLFLSLKGESRSPSHREAERQRDLIPDRYLIDNPNTFIHLGDER